MKRFKWTVEIEVSGELVEDGFDMTEARLNDMAENLDPYGLGIAPTVKVLKAPSKDEIRKIQGYEVKA